MRRVLLALSLIVVCRCAAPPPPEPMPEPVAPRAAVVREAQEGEKVIGTVRVTASALNVRAEASTEAGVVTQVKKGQALDVLREDDAWVKVRLASGETGWVASRFVSSGSAPARTTAKKRSGCPADSDYAFTETPMLAFSDSGAHGMVVVEAAVNAKGVVTATKVLSNGTGDDALGFLAEREIKGAKFSPPIRDCVPRSFIFTYRRTF
ncbi:MAG TPA: SH3 domain-containing protein [Thermoanaerobaculia bacterium]